MDGFLLWLESSFFVSWFNISFFSSVLYALVILLIGFAVGKLLGIVLFKFLSNLEFDRGLKFFKIKRGFSRRISFLVSVLIYCLAVVLALLSLGVLSLVLFIVLYFILFLLFGSFLLGLFFVLPNFFAYFFVKSRLKVGVLVSVGRVKGEVISVGFFSVRLKSSFGDFFLVPNSLFKKGFKVFEK